MTLEANGLSSDLLRLGAEQAAAGKTLGLSPEETFNLQQHLRERGIKNVRAEDDAPDPFGEAVEQAYDDRGMPVGEPRRPQDDFRPADSPAKIGRAREGEVMNMRPGKSANRKVPEGQSPRNPLIRGEKVRGGGLPEEFLTDNEVAEGIEGRAREVDGGRRAVADALGLMQQAEDKYGMQAFGADGPKMERLIRRLEEDANPGPVERKRGREAAAQMIQNDQRVFNTAEIDGIVAAELNNRFGGEEYVRADGKRINKGAAARIAAERGIERQLGQFDIPIDQLAAAESEIRAGLAGRGGVNAELAETNVVNNRMRQGFQNVLGDQAGVRNLANIGDIKNLGANYEDAQMMFLDDGTTPTVGPAQGPLPRNQRWMVDNLPDFKEDGQFPQVGILEEGKLFADRLRGMGANVPRAEVRNLAELQQAADFVVKEAAAKGERLGRYDKAAGGMVFTDNPGIQEVLYKMRYSDNEAQRLANAMNQVEMQGIAGGPNATRAEMFAERIPGGIGRGVEVYDNNPNMRADAGVPLALIKNEKVGRDKAAQGVRAELANIGPEDVVRQLDAAGMLYTQDAAGQKIMLPEAANIIAGADAGRNDAQMAIQGGLKGEVPRANFIRGDVRQMGRPERVRRFGKQNADAAGRVEANFLAGEEARRRRAGEQQIVQIRKRGPVKDFPEVSRTDAGEGFRNVAVPSSKQPIQPAQVAASIAPDPWAGTGPARRESGGMATAPTPQMALPAGRSSRPMPADMRAELFALPNRSGDTGRSIMQSGPQVTDKSDYYMDLPDGPETSPSFRRKRSAVGAHQNTRKMGRRIGYGAAGAAGATGLAALIGGERDQREQEQY